jgi:small multidrug resistance pump
MKWLILILAIAFEVGGTTLMKLSSGFSKPIYSAGLFVCYAASLALLTLALRHFEVSTVYAVWSGVGVAAIALIGMVWLGEAVSAAKIACLALLLIGVGGLNLTSHG